MVCIYNTILFLSPCLTFGYRGRIMSLLCSHIKYNSNTRYRSYLCEHRVGDQKQMTTKRKKPNQGGGQVEGSHRRGHGKEKRPIG